MNRPSDKLASRPTPFPKPSHTLPGTTMKAARPAAHCRYMCRKAKNMSYSTNINDFLLNFAQDERRLGI